MALSSTLALRAMQPKSSQQFLNAQSPLLTMRKSEGMAEGVTLSTGQRLPRMLVETCAAQILARHSIKRWKRRQWFIQVKAVRWWNLGKS